jgi:hypothetical protein
VAKEKDKNSVSPLALSGKGTFAEALARMRANNPEFANKVEESTSTRRVALQQKREKLAEKITWMQTISDQLFKLEEEIGVLSAKELPDAKILLLTQKKQMASQRLMNLAQLTTLTTYLEGTALLVDCLTVEEKCRVKGPDGEMIPGKRRSPISDILEDMDDDLTVLSRLMLDFLVPMVRDIGNKQQAFVNEHGLLQPAKYDYDEEEKEEDENGPVVSENEAVAERIATGKPRSLDELRQELSGRESGESGKSGEQEGEKK